jgi:hypothetical protein
VEAAAAVTAVERPAADHGGSSLRCGSGARREDQRQQLTAAGATAAAAAATAVALTAVSAAAEAAAESINVIKTGGGRRRKRAKRDFSACDDNGRGCAVSLITLIVRIFQPRPPPPTKTAAA